MFPFELVATATDSPSDSPGGSLRKLGTDVKAISGTPVIVAFCCATAEAVSARTIAAQAAVRCRVMDASTAPMLHPAAGSAPADDQERQQRHGRARPSQPRPVARHDVVERERPLQRVAPLPAERHPRIRR